MCPTNWVDFISIPSRFSVTTEQALKEGVPTKKARDEIVNALATLIMVYTTRPSPKDVSTICEKLIQRHPVLKDHVRGSYVSFHI